MISICCFFLFAVFYAITKLYKCPNMQFNDFNKDNSTLLGGGIKYYGCSLSYKFNSF